MTIQEIHTSHEETAIRHTYQIRHRMWIQGEITVYGNGTDAFIFDGPMHTLFVHSQYPLTHEDLANLVKDLTTELVGEEGLR